MEPARQNGGSEVDAGTGRDWGSRIDRLWAAIFTSGHNSRQPAYIDLPTLTLAIVLNTYVTKTAMADTTTTEMFTATSAFSVAGVSVLRFPRMSAS